MAVPSGYGVTYLPYSADCCNNGGKGCGRYNCSACPIIPVVCIPRGQYANDLLERGDPIQVGRLIQQANVRQIKLATIAAMSNPCYGIATIIALMLPIVICIWGIGLPTSVTLPGPSYSNDLVVRAPVVNLPGDWSDTVGIERYANRHAENFIANTGLGGTGVYGYVAPQSQLGRASAAYNGGVAIGGAGVFIGGGGGTSTTVTDAQTECYTFWSGTCDDKYAVPGMITLPPGLTSQARFRGGSCGAVCAQNPYATSSTGLNSYLGQCTCTRYPDGF